jgi:hypothetical protein
VDLAIVAIIIAAVNTAGTLGLAWWVAHRDSSRVVVEGSIGHILGGPLVVATPRFEAWDVAGKEMFTVNVINAGRRPVRIEGAGIALRVSLLWSPLFHSWGQRRDRILFLTANQPLPALLNEQDKVTFFTPYEDLESNLTSTLRSAHQIKGAYSRDLTGRRYFAKLSTRDWRRINSAIKAARSVRSNASES